MFYKWRGHTWELDAEDTRWLHAWEKDNKAGAKQNPVFKKLLKILPVVIAPMENGELSLDWTNEELDRLVKHGKFFSPEKLIEAKMKNSACHQNVAELYYDERIEKIVSGFAITERDPAWRSHSWGLLKGKIVETTVPRAGYFGYILTPKEADEFVFYNE